LPRRKLILHDSERGIVHQAADQTVVGVIGDIEKLRSRLQVLFLANAEIADEAPVMVLRPTSPN
jgi:hypothetical protein